MERRDYGLSVAALKDERSGAPAERQRLYMAFIEEAS
jgi:hypothetical protein